nr:hypothetical protein [uncultured Prevotella sp.]
MKKFFTLIAAVAMAASVNAQTTLVDYPTSQAGITLHNAAGNITYATVKIHTNTQSVNCIKVAKSFSTDKKVTDDYVELTAEGGFKAGDVVSITGVYNNASEKNAAIAIFSGKVGEEASILFKTDNFINARLVNDDPTAQTYTLTQDAATLQLGRNGNTGACITKLTVVRGGTPTGISNLEASASAKSSILYNLAGQQVSESYKGIVVKNGKKYLNK